MWFDPLVSWLLHSPLHRLVSKEVMFISLTGRKSGKTVATPTNYLRDGNALWVVSWRDRNWWKNLRGGAQVRVLLAGDNREGFGQVLEDEEAVAQSLNSYYEKVPRMAKYVEINLDEMQRPIQKDCKEAAQKLVMVKIDL